MENRSMKQLNFDKTNLRECAGKVDRCAHYPQLACVAPMTKAPM
jgi:hypothetical protein